MFAKIRQKWRSSTLGRSASVLSRSDQRKIFAVVILQISMGALDLLGVALIGVLGALAVNGVQSRGPGNRVTEVLQLLNLDGQTFQVQAAWLGVSAAILLIGRTFLSVLFTRKTLFFLSRRAARISAMLVSKLLSKSLLFVQSRTSQEILYSVTTGVNIITLGVLGTGVSLISDVSLLLVMGVGLFVVDPIIAVSTAIFFGLIGYALYSLMHKKAAALGLEQAEKGIASNEKIIEVLHSYRESVVRNRRSFYAQEIGNLRLQLSNNMAETTFLPYVSKYVIESTVVLGALIISAVQFMLQDASHAVATLAVFLAAGTRIAPAVMRVQQGAILIRSSLGSAAPTLELIEELHDTLEIDAVDQHLVLVHHGFEPNVVIKNVSFAYPGNHKSALTEINLKINSGQVVAFVGTSGAGKTTLVDILLGVLQPEQGLIEISGVAPLIAVAKWPGAISYIPQDVTISNGTIRENVALGYPIEDATDELVWNALKLAQLSEFVETLPAGLETKVGERGTRISGGQRQRLGIARGLFTKPKLLVLDEATSAVDGQTEAEISDAVHALKGEVTVVLIAHRLSTVRHADQVIYLEEGKIIAKGTFDEIRIKVPNFDHQAKLMGL